MHTDIVTFEFKNQPVTTSHEIARVTGIAHDMVLRSIRTQRQYYEELNQRSVFDRDFIVATDKLIFCINAEKSKSAKKGRPSTVYLLTKEGALSFIGGLRGKKACEFRIAIANAFIQMEQIIAERLPALESENLQLRLENEQLKSKKKRIAGPKTGMIPAPIYQEDLFGQLQAIAYVMTPKQNLHPTIEAKSKARHMRKMMAGLSKKLDELSDKIEHIEASAHTKILNLLTNKKTIKNDLDA